MTDNVIDLGDLNKQERDAELTLLAECEKFSSQGAKRIFCASIGCSWDEYLRLCRKYRRLLEAYRREKKK